MVFGPLLVAVPILKTRHVIITSHQLHEVEWWHRSRRSEPRKEAKSIAITASIFYAFTHILLKTMKLAAK